MTVAIAVAAAVLGALTGGLHMRRVMSDIGPGWRDWQSAEPIGGGRAPLIGLAVTALLALAFAGTFMPAWSRAVIIALVFGYCASWFVEGLRRFSRET